MTAQVVRAAPQRPRRRRRLLWNIAGVLVALSGIVTALALWANSAQFQNMVRHRLVSELQNATGGRVEVGTFQWRLFDLEAEAGGIVIHGDEPATEAPYAQIRQLRARVSILGFWWHPRILLRNLEIAEPRFHLILYRDGQTNQPHPAASSGSKRSGMETLFNLQAGHIAVERGWVDIDDRAADNLDARNRYQPLDFQCDDVSVAMSYVHAGGHAPEAYHIDASAKDLTLTRGGSLAGKIPTVHGFLQASIDLTRNAATLRSVRITGRTKDAPDRTLEISGAITDLAHSRWQVLVGGELDMHLLNPLFGYDGAPEGIARLNLTAGGEGNAFHIDGTVHAEKAAYVETGVVERGIDLNAKVHADKSQLLITSVSARLPQGGEIDGEVLLHDWLPVEVKPVVVEAVPPPGATLTLRNRMRGVLNPKPSAPPKPPAVPPHSTLLRGPEVIIPVHGIVNAVFKNVSIDTVLDMVSDPPYQRLGFDALLNGPANANWVNGDDKTLAVKAQFAMSPSGRPIPGEAPATGTIDATYTHRDGAVDLRALNMNLPTSHFLAHGHLGAHPMTSPSALIVDFHSGRLAEFDTLFRDLGLTANGKSGVAALPIGLDGQADFRGTWNGSLQSPRLNGQLQATQVTLELSPAAGASGQSRVLRWDTVEGEGSYDAERIVIAHGQLQRGPAQVIVDGTLTGAASPTQEKGAELPSFNGNSIALVHAHLNRINAANLLPLAGVEAPIRGSIDGQITADGPVRNLGASGWVQLTDGAVYGEPISSLRVQGALTNQVFKIASIAAKAPAGTINAQGSYDLNAQRIDIEGTGNGLDIAKLEHVRSSGSGVTGSLSFRMAVAGTRDDPSIEGRAGVSSLKVQGESLGDLQINAHTANHALLYSATTRYQSAEVSMRGQTTMHGDYATDATLDFTSFDVGTMFRLANIQGISAQSALSGMAQIAGPLARPGDMRGDLRVRQLAMTVAGVHLKSDAGLHAALDNGRVSLDAMHITGEETDMRAQGSLGLKDTRRIDFAASGSINLKLMETIDSDITASGNTNFQIEAHGPLANPDLRGRVEFQNGSIALEDLPNSLSQLHGTLEFNQNRLEIRSLTALTGGGQLSIGGYLAYQHGLYANLSLTGRSVRIRYPSGVSSLADASLQLQGTQSNLLFSGNVLITRFSVSPDLDIAALAAQANGVQPVVQPNAPSNHVRVDVRIQSSPQLNFQNAYAKLAGDVDLRLRGTVASPSLQGRISITEGNATIAGTRYELQRGDVTFTNPVRIQPNIDLSATARVEDYDISLGLHGTPDKLTVSYRSDPPLPEADVVALLALGRTQSEQGIYTEQQQQSAGINPSTDVLLGGALNATVSSRVQKLFGAGSVKVDPSYLAALGNSTTRVTVEEQLGKNVTLIYATNVDTTAQQLLQAEVAINRHVSLQVTRDESGVFSMVIKAIRRYK
ncbi:MAG TPA: translocation/assembly module TamB domain-containing protein [Terracidiphilus sp.]|jgi:translocation and assembly module TamB